MKSKADRWILEELLEPRLLVSALLLVVEPADAIGRSAEMLVGLAAFWEAEIRSWSRAERAAARRWAIGTHLDAGSEGRRCPPRERPACVDRLPSWPFEPALVPGGGVRLRPGAAPHQRSFWTEKWGLITLPPGERGRLIRFTSAARVDVQTARGVVWGHPGSWTHDLTARERLAKIAGLVGSETAYEGDEVCAFTSEDAEHFADTLREVARICAEMAESV